MSGSVSARSVDMSGGEDSLASVRLRNGTVATLPAGIERHTLEDLFAEARRRLVVRASLRRFAQKYSNAVENYTVKNFKAAFETLNALKNSCEPELTTTKAFVYMHERCETCMLNPPAKFSPVFESKEK